MPAKRDGVITTSREMSKEEYENIRHIVRKLVDAARERAD